MENNISKATTYPIFVIKYSTLEEKYLKAYVAASSERSARSMLERHLEREGDSLLKIISAQKVVSGNMKDYTHSRQMVLDSEHVDRTDCVPEGFMAQLPI